MQRRITSAPVFLAASLAFACCQPAAARTYNVDRSLNFGAAHLSGTIETDGRTGEIGTYWGGITGWDLTLFSRDYDVTVVLTPDNSYTFGRGTLMATPGELTYSFDHKVNGYLAFISNDPIHDLVCLQTSIGQCSYGDGAGIGITLHTNDLLEYLEPMSGTQVIAVASAVPEPASLALWLAGAGALVAARCSIRPVARSGRPRVRGQG